MSRSNCLGIVLSFLLVSLGSAAQKAIPDTASHITIAADTSFLQHNASYQKKWGTNRRAEWATPVKVPFLWLNLAYGGLKPYEKGGGNESRTLHLKNAAGKDYTLRSITKSRDDVIPADFSNTFVEDIIRDGVSNSYPYGSFALATMQEKAGLYYTMPLLVYLPHQDALDSFDARFGNSLFLLEQRPDGDWTESANLGHFNDFNSTEKVIKKILENNNNQADQFAFAKARLFDMLIGDWDRHEGNWRWGEKEDGNKKLYLPVARDRDQAFYTHNGALLDRLLSLGGFSFMQNFGQQFGDPVTLNGPEKDFDRFFTNKLDSGAWIAAATELQQALTDTVIAASIHQLPPEIFAVSGRELIEKLRSRRGQLVELAVAYYHSLAKIVQVTGSEEREYFEVNSDPAGGLTVIISDINKSGQKKESFYKRTFFPNETAEIRLFGIGNEDVYKLDIHSPIKVRIIGGPAKDSVMSSGDPVDIYDDRNNSFQTGSARMHLSSDSAVHAFQYDYHRYDSKGFSPVVSYNYEDRVYVGLSYSVKKNKFRREPFANRHTVSLNYSLSQHAIKASYAALFPQMFGKWDPFINIDFDAVKWTNFYGLGNETVSFFTPAAYYRMISRDWLAAVGIRRTFGKSTVELAGFFQRMKIKNVPFSYASYIFGSDYKEETKPNNYGGLWLLYKYVSVNDRIVPTKGFQFLFKGVYDNNFTKEEFFQRYTVKAEGFIPLSKKFSLNIRAGGSTLLGADDVLNTAQVYQHAVLGGSESLRGYRWERFWGKTAFYNNNELRFITDIRVHIMNARIGLLAFFDDGRVWMPNENSNTIHTSYGGGILLAPFKLVSFTVTYGITEEKDLFQFKINSLF